MIGFRAMILTKHQYPDQVALKVDSNMTSNRATMTGTLARSVSTRMTATSLAWGTDMEVPVFAAQDTSAANSALNIIVFRR